MCNDALTELLDQIPACFSYKLGYPPDDCLDESSRQVEAYRSYSMSQENGYTFATHESYACIALQLCKGIYNHCVDFKLHCFNDKYSLFLTKVLDFVIRFTL